MAVTSQAIRSNQNYSVLNQIDKRKLFNRIDQIHGVNGSRILVFDGKQFHELRPHPPVCMANKLTVIIKPKEKEEKVLNRSAVSNCQDQSGFFQELVSTGLSCSAAALTWVVVGDSSAAIPVSGGASTFITVLAWSAATASTAQCVNSAFRLYHETEYGDSEMNTWLDSQEWYASTSTVLDIVSVAGGVAATGAAIKMAHNLRRGTGKSIREVLKQLSRQERKKSVKN